jgi:hypothetical protein
MQRTSLAALAATIAALALPGMASADTFCVNVPTSECLLGTQKNTIQGALDASDGNGQADLVKIGAKPTPYDEDQFVYHGDERITITGAGAEKTVLAGSGVFPVLSVESPVSEITHLGIEVPDVDHGTGLYTDAAASSLKITYGGQNQTTRGMNALGGARLDDSRIAMGAVGHGVWGSDPSAPLFVRDSTINAAAGVSVRPGSWANLSRLFIRGANVGIIAMDGKVDADNLVITHGAGPANGVVAFGGTAVSLAHGTLVGGGSGANGVIVGAETSASTSVELDDSVIAGYGHSVFRQGEGTGSADFTARYSSFGGGAMLHSEGQGTLSIAGNGNLLDVDPQFTAPDALIPNFKPLPSSPLVDAADPLDPVMLDVLGAPRPLDGDGVGGARSDIGAIEREAAPPPPGDPANPGDAGEPATPAEPVDPAQAAAGPDIRIGPRRLRLTRKGYARLRVTCPESADERCVGRLRLERKPRGSVRTAATRRFSVPAGRAANVAVRVPRGLRRLVARKAVRVQVVATARDATSASRSTRRTVTVLRYASTGRGR